MKNISCLADLEEAAEEKLDMNTKTYFQTGSMDMITRDENRSAYDRIQIRPRFLRNVKTVDTGVRVFGDSFKSPIFYAASGMQRMAHSDGEIGAARSACKRGTLHCLSSVSNYSIEEVAKSVRDLTENGENKSVRWLQLYVFEDRKVSFDLIKRAEDSGYKGIVITVDTPYVGRRLGNIRYPFEIPKHLQLGNFVKYSDGNHIHKITKVDPKKRYANVNYANHKNDAGLTWEDAKFIKSQTKLPVLLKGILTYEDAELAVKHGFDGIIVSNHGGRQLDSAPATIDALPEVAAAVNKRIPVFVDGGILRGTDVFKALALGADAVFVGRPVLWGLAYNGEDGVDLMADIINEEFRLAMALSGCCRISDITESYVSRKNSHFSKL
ncbi:Hydroxyacid oxidase 1 [Smittium culicis]|uniref:Oxidase FUB9 n=1 Tax=Smittium culicis TaxID=133412 RepID=A0A1R1YA60_9FUNG|nr:Hydroxyacid oxidase 1 [Smittium culicis]